VDTQRWLRAGDIFDRVFAAPRAERSALLDELCRTDPDLKQIVASMLDAEESALEFEQAAAAIVGQGGGATTTENAGDGPLPLPGRIGPWRLVEKLGDGGMGVVWLAERADGQFEQRAALKLIKRGMDSDAVLARFLRERQILARLQHPNIAHLLDGGITDDGRPYFAMEYVDGKALLRYCHDNDLKLEDRIRLFLDVCAAVQFAHRHYVVHRDLKPSNVLVTANGEVKLLDFGIAKVLVDSGTGEPTLTQAKRERPMSPAYAAPEQFSGGTITEATDIYALGCVLYQLLTDKYAYDFRGVSRPDDMRRIIEASDPTPPSRLRLTAPPVPPKHLRGDLDTIVLAALKHDPARRYPSVAAFAEDLRNYLDGKPISARRDHLLYRGYKYIRRHRVGVAATVAVVLIAVAAVLFELRVRTPGGPPASGTSLAIVDFSNLSQGPQNAWIAEALASELATELTVGGILHTLPGELVRPAHADLPAPTAGGYGPESLQKLQKRLDADYVLSGSYLVIGAGDAATLRVDVALQEARSGADLAHFAQSDALAELPKLVEKAGAELRGKLQLTAGSATELQQVARAQPSTYELSRRMGIAQEALHNSDPARARDELLNAVVVAPDYAPAYLLLARAYKTLGYDAKALAEAQRAAANSSNLPPAQQLQIKREVAVQRAEWVDALAADRRLLELDPKDPDFHLALVSDLLNSGNPDAADAALATLRELPGSDDPRIELAAVDIARTRGDLKAYREHAQKALESAQARDETGLVAHARRQLGIALDQTGESDRAAALFREAIADFQRIDNPGGEAGARTSLGLLLQRTNQKLEAMEEYERALAIYQRIGDQDGLAAIYSNIARVLWERGDREAAETAAHRVLEIRTEMSDVAGQAWATLALAQLQLDDAASDAALASYRDAIALDERAGEGLHHQSVLREYSDALWLRGNLEEARDVCARALAEAQQLSNPGAISDTGVQCAIIERDGGDMAEAVRQLEHAGKIAESSGNAQAVTQVNLVLGQIEAASGAPAEACQRLERAIEQFRSAGETAFEAEAQARIALCYLQLNRPQESKSAASRAQELRSSITIRRQATIVDCLLAELLGENGEHARAASRLLDLAGDAEKRQWTALELEARLAALPFFDSEPARAQQRDRVLQKARQHGFVWILRRIDAASKS
jgi:tetratricopeptide (TPR) repeat protein